jgi:hypothetical protein
MIKGIIATAYFILKGMLITVSLIDELSLPNYVINSQKGFYHNQKPSNVRNKCVSEESVHHWSLKLSFLQNKKHSKYFIVS